MMIIEGIRIQNFCALRDVTLSKLSPLTAIIGENNAGKSSLLDVFNFVADCLAYDVETACHLKQIEGFEQLRSQGATEPMRFEFCCRETSSERLITYELAIDLDRKGRPFVLSETMRQLAGNEQLASPLLELERSRGTVWAGEETEDSTANYVELTDTRRLGIATLGALKEHPRIHRFVEFVKSWHMSRFSPDAARSLPFAGAHRHLNARGDNLGNVLQYLERDHKDVLQSIASKIPGIRSIDTKVTDDRRLLLRFNEGAFADPFFAQQMSDGTLKLLAYLTMLRDPNPYRLICIEEPESSIYPRLLPELVEEFQQATERTQLIVTTNSPFFINSLRPEDVRVLHRDVVDGYTRVRRAIDMPGVQDFIHQGAKLGDLWMEGHLDAPFAPDWVSPPGDTIADVLEERGWTQAELARRLGYTEKHVSQLINGKAAITEDTASRLERVLGSTAGFWLRKEATYRERLERQQSASEAVTKRTSIRKGSESEFGL